MRTFEIIVDRGDKPFRYPPLDIEKSIKLMRKLKERGFHALASTSANGITEYLNLDQLIEAQA